MSQASSANNLSVNRVFLKNVDHFMGVARALAAKKYMDAEDVEIISRVFSEKPELTDHPVLNEIASMFSAGTATNLLTPPGLNQLHQKLRELCGLDGNGLPKGSTTILFEDPPPVILFDKRLFCFTGTFQGKSRIQCFKAVEDRGGEVTDNVTLGTDYLVVGSNVTETWMHQTFGHKITQAKAWNDSGASSIKIVSQAHWETYLHNTSSTHPKAPSSSSAKTSSDSNSGSVGGSGSAKASSRSSSGSTAGGTVTRSLGDAMFAALLPYILIVLALAVVFAIGWSVGG